MRGRIRRGHSLGRQLQGLAAGESKMAARHREQAAAVHVGRGPAHVPAGPSGQAWTLAGGVP